jgi:hypothetical protein
MPPFLEILAYNLEVEWTLTWFPIRSTATLKEVRMRGGTIRHKSNDPPFGAGNRQGYLLAQVATGEGDSIAPQEIVRAYIDVGVRSDGMFDANFQVHIGSSTRSKSVVLRPDTKTPFMINVRPVGDDPVIKDTAAVFQGLFTASPRISLLDIAVRIISP